MHGSQPFLSSSLWEHWVNERLYTDRTKDTVRLALTHRVHPDDMDYVLDNRMVSSTRLAPPRLPFPSKYPFPSKKR